MPRNYRRSNFFYYPEHYECNSSTSSSGSTTITDCSSSSSESCHMRLAASHISNTKKCAVLKAISNNSIVNLTQPQIDEIVVYVNNYRSLHQLEPLTWDSTIATYSQNWSNYLLKNNVFQHSGTSIYGENLAYFKGYGTDPVQLIKLAIDMWYDEIKYYDFNNPGFSEKTGHFTALVWKASTTFGMGIAINPDTSMSYITMNLSPPGNVDGQFKENVLPPVSTNTGINKTEVPTPSMTNPINNVPPPPQFDKSILVKAAIVNKLYNIITELNSSKMPNKYIINELNKIIMSISKI